VKRAIEIASQSGAKRAVLLPVSAPFHSSLMMPAQERLEKDLRATTFADPHVPVVTNVDADTIKKGDEAREALIRQVTMPVRWEESMRMLLDEGVNTFIEVGPGRVLTGIMRQIERSVTTLNVEDEKKFAGHGGTHHRGKIRRGMTPPGNADLQIGTSELRHVGAALRRLRSTGLDCRTVTKRIFPFQADGKKVNANV